MALGKRGEGHQETLDLDLNRKLKKKVGILMFNGGERKGESVLRVGGGETRKKRATV